MASAGSVAMVIVGDLLAIIGGRRSRTRGFRLVSYCFAAVAGPDVYLDGYPYGHGSLSLSTCAFSVVWELKLTDVNTTVMKKPHLTKASAETSCKAFSR